MAQRTIGQGMGFERTRRITGYCASVQRFCDAKEAELNDRVLHVNQQCALGTSSPGYGRGKYAD